MHRPILERVKALARNANEKVARFGQGDGELAGGIGLGFLGSDADTRAANRSVIFVDHAAVKRHVGVERKNQTGANRQPFKSRWCFTEHGTL